MKPLSAALRPLLGAAFALVVTAFGPAGGSSAATTSLPADGTELAQADTSGVPVFQGDEDEGTDEEEVPIPPNLQDKEMLPDTSGAAPDTLRESLPVSPAPVNPALPDTLHMPTGQPPQGVSGTRSAPGAPSAPGKSRGSLFGLAPIVVIAAIVVVNVFLIRAIGGG
jgi:hypothetical protein